MSLEQKIEALTAKIEALTAAVTVLTVALGDIHDGGGAITQTASDEAETKPKTKATGKPAAAKTATKTKQPDPEPANEGGEEEGKVTFEYLGEKVRRLAATNRSEVLAVLSEFGAGKLQEVDPDDYVKVDIQLIKLENKLAKAKKADETDDDLA